MVKLALAAVSALALTGAAETPDQPAISRFKCADGPDLTAEFATRGARFGAIVDAGDGPHFLPAQPWSNAPVKLTWSDGRRTLTWSPGVLITWADGGAAKVCGRSGPPPRTGRWSWPPERPQTLAAPP
jgi:hypothetical protein